MKSEKKRGGGDRERLNGGLMENQDQKGVGEGEGERGW